MKHCRIAALVIAFFIVSDVHAQSQPKVRTDLLGDPLPEGAIARLGTTRMRLSYNGNSGRCVLSFAPHGKECVSFGPGYGINIWDCATGKKRLLFDSLPDGHAWCTAISNDGKWLAAGGLGFALWDFATGKKISDVAPNDCHPLALAFNDNGNNLMSADRGGVVRWWDTSKRRIVRTWEPLETLKWDKADGKPIPGLIRAAFSPNGRTLVAHLGNMIIKLGVGVHSSTSAGVTVAWDVETGQELWRLNHKDGPYDFSFTPDGKRLVCDFGWDEIGIVDVATGKRQDCLSSAETPLGGFNCFAFAPDGKSIVVGGENSNVCLWCIGSKAIHPLHCNSAGLAARVYALAFAPDGKSLMAAINDSLQLVDVASGKVRLAFDGHHEQVHHLRFSADGELVNTGSRNTLSYSQTDESLFWEPRTGKLKVRSDSIGLSKNNDLEAASEDHTIGLRWDSGRFHFVDIATGKSISSLEGEVKLGNPPLGFFSPANRYYLACASRSEDLIAYDVQTGKRLCNLDSWLYNRQAFSSDDRLIAWQEPDGICIVDIETGKQRMLGSNPSSPEPLAFSPDNKRIASWDETNKDVILWDIASAKKIRRLPAAERNWANKICFAWSPDGRLFADAGVTEGIRIWEVATGKLRRDFKGHGEICGLAFSPESRLLASSSADTTVLIWDLMAR